MCREGDEDKDKSEPEKGEPVESEEPKEEKELDEKDEKLKELTSTLQYLQAEYENYKKRAAKDFDTIIKFSNEGLMLKLLPVLDDFEAALESIEDIEIHNGVKLVYDNLLKTLAEEGLQEIKALGESFDPYKHEAVLEVNDPDRKDGSVAEVVQKGYSFKSKVIRPSKVKVVKHHQEEDKEVGENG
jgi:molecular chaperone GrpE